MVVARRKKKHTLYSPDPTDQSYEALIRLWVLRLIVLLGGSREFVTSYGYNHDDLAGYLELTPVADKFEMARAISALRRKHAHAERQQQRCCLPDKLNRNLDRCGELLGWSDTDKAVIAFAVLVETDRRLERAVSLINDVSTACLIDVLACLLGRERDEVRRSVSPKGQLSESGFLKIDPRVMRSLGAKLSLLSDEVADQLRHNDEADLVHLLRDVVAQAAPSSLSLDDFRHVKTLDVLHLYLNRSLERQSTGVNVFIHGAPGTGKTQLASALADALGCALFDVSSQNEAGNGIDGGGRLRAFRAAQSMLQKRKAMILFDEAEDVFDGSWQFGKSKSSAQAPKAWMNRLLETNPVPTIWLSNAVDCLDPAFLRRFDVVLEMPLAQGRHRERLLDEACGDLIASSTRNRLLDARGLAPAVIQRATRVVRAVRDHLPGDQAGEVLERLIENTLVAQGHGALASAGANALPPNYDPGHIAADIDLAEVADGIVCAKVGRICLYGPPGTGKTAFGRWLATRLDAPLHARRVSDIVSPYVGQTERNLARVFREAESDGALLLLDEVDSFLQDRSHAQRSWEVTAVNEMLTQMEAYGGVFIASTNLIDGLDQAALRRFDLKVKFGYLRPAQAWDLFTRHCESLGLPAPVASDRAEVERLTKLTPGDFAAVARQHRFRPIGGVAALVAALTAECSMKRGSSKAVGFI